MEVSKVGRRTAPPSVGVGVVGVGAVGGALAHTISGRIHGTEDGTHTPCSRSMES